MRRIVARTAFARTVFAGVLAAALLPCAAHADDADKNPPLAEMPLTKPEDGARFSFDRAGDGFLRLDRTTGQVSRCSQRTAGWSCQPVPEERAALESEIARLQDENAGLKRQLAEAGPSKDVPAGERKGYRVPETQLRLPTNEDIDRALSVVERVWKRLMRMLNDVRADITEKI